MSLIISTLTLPSIAQRNGSLRLMTYNILNYRNGTTYCTGSNNSSSGKESGIHTIVDYAQPDLIVFNEVGYSANNPTYLLNNALNTGGTTSWATAPHTHNGFSSLVNCVAYNSDRLQIGGQWTITKDLSNNSLVRLIDVVQFQLIDSLWTGATYEDTTDFYIIAAHFKAGNTTADAADRADAADAIIDWIENTLGTSEPHNIFVMGDLNTYTSSEDSYQALVGGSGYRLEDPISSSGNWHNNGSFAAIHTQSTSTTSDCKSGGGLDDRLDHILMSESVGEGDNGLTYAPNTYITVGNDGNHFNSSVNSGTNYSASSSVISALASVSDHLPVIMDVEFSWSGLGTDDLLAYEVRWPNPMPQNYAPALPVGASLEVLNLVGQRIWSAKNKAPLPHLPAGSYLFKISGARGTTVKKVTLR